MSIWMREMMIKHGKLLVIWVGGCPVFEPRRHPCPLVFRASALRMWRKLRSNWPRHWNRSAPCSAVDFSWRPVVPCVPEMLFASKSSFVLEAICRGGLRLTWNAYRIFKVFKETELSCIMNYVESCGNMRKFGPHSEPIQSPLRTWCASFGQPAS